MEEHCLLACPFWPVWSAFLGALASGGNALSELGPPSFIDDSINQESVPQVNSMDFDEHVFLSELPSFNDSSVYPVDKTLAAHLS